MLYQQTVYQGRDLQQCRLQRTADKIQRKQRKFCKNKFLDNKVDNNDDDDNENCEEIDIVEEDDEYVDVIVLTSPVDFFNQYQIHVSLQGTSTSTTSSMLALLTCVSDNASYKRRMRQPQNKINLNNVPVLIV